MFCKIEAATALLAICLSASVSDAAAEPGLVGAGEESCQTFLHKAGSGGLSDSAANQWVLGYLTGRVATMPSDRHYPFAAPAAIMAWIASYCRATQDFKGINLDTAAASFFMTTRAVRQH